MKKAMLCMTISLILLSTWVFVPFGKAFTGDVLSAWASTVPNIDGVTNPNEWDDAAKVTFTLVSNSLESHSATIYEKNDETYMYLAVRVVGDDFNAGDGVFFYFDSDHDGGIENGDDWLYVLAWTGGLGHAEDGYYNASVSTLSSDEGDGGTNDIVGGASHTNVSGIGDYTFELRHPLNSADDAHDFSLKPNDTIGFKMEFDDAYSGGAQSSTWPGLGQFAEVHIEARAADTTAPKIILSSQNPPRENVQPYQNVTISANATDAESGIKNVTLICSFDNGTSWESPQTMRLNFSTNLYEAIIPGQPAQTWVRFKIVVYDNAGNNATIDGTEPYCVYQVLPEFATILILPLFTIMTLLAMILKRKKTNRQRL
jgi:hypothetical protein